MNINEQTRFTLLYERYLNELTLQGKSPKTIEMYSRYLRKIGDYFDCCPDNLTADQLKSYFMQLVETRSWSAVKIARNAIQFFYKHVLDRPWTWINIVKPPKLQPLQDVLSVSEVELIINHTYKLSYQVYFLTTYSLGLRLTEALNLTIADIDGHLMRVHIRRGKGNKDRFVPLPLLTYKALRRYWATHRHPRLIFPGGKAPYIREGKEMVMDKGGVQKAIKIIAKECGIAKNVHIHTLRHSFATHLLENGVNLRSIQTYLGHVSPDTTAKYTRMTQEAAQNSALMVNALVDQFEINWIES
ncbi:tyrosine-type recombinase/integrase [Alkalimarinus coralli]|uniref:tyrosine-type recombinase/integrase n=1 Tax=Alkalimarinus coralli TaxID=2935863 RepID=UPI00202B18C4|nr:site-specific integrase [Alkalimarinus coralli]